MKSPTAVGTSSSSPQAAPHHPESKEADVPLSEMGDALQDPHNAGATHEKTAKAQGFFSTVKGLVKKYMAKGANYIDAPTCGLVAEGKKAFELKFCFGLHWGLPEFQAPPATLALPETAASFIANSVLLKCVQEIVTAPLRAALRVAKKGAKALALKLVAKIVGSALAVRDSVAPNHDESTEEHQSGHGHSHAGGHGHSDCDNPDSTELEKAQCASAAAEGQCHGTTHIHACADTISLVIGIFHFAPPIPPLRPTSHLTGLGLPIGIDYSMKSCGNAFVKALQAGVRKLIGAKSDPSAPENIAKQFNPKENQAAKNELAMQRLNNDQERNTEMMALGMCNPSCDKVDKFHAISVAIPGLMKGAGLAALIGGGTAGVSMLGGIKHDHGGGHGRRLLSHPPGAGSEGGDDHGAHEEYFMVETVFSVGPVWDAAMCFVKTIGSLFWGLAHSEQLRVCKDKCTYNAEVNDCPTFQEAKYTDAESGIVSNNKSQGQCVSTGKASEPTAGRCARCMAADNKCRFDTDCSSGYCSGNRMGIRDGRCLDHGLPAGSPCTRDVECKSHDCDGWYRGSGYKGACKADKAGLVALQCEEVTNDPSTRTGVAHKAGCPCYKSSDCLSRSCAGNMFGLGKGTCTAVGPARLEALDKMIAANKMAREEMIDHAARGLGCQPSNICCVKKGGMLASRDKCMNSKNDNVDILGFSEFKMRMYRGSRKIPKHLSCAGPDRSKSHNGHASSFYLKDRGTCQGSEFHRGECMCQQCPEGFEPIAFKEGEEQTRCCDAGVEMGKEHDCKITKCSSHTNTFDGVVLGFKEFTAFQGVVKKNTHGKTNYIKTHVGMGTHFHNVYVQIKVAQSNQRFYPSRILWSSSTDVRYLTPGLIKHRTIYPRHCNSKKGLQPRTDVGYNMEDLTIRIVTSCKRQRVDRRGDIVQEMSDDDILWRNHPYRPILTEKKGGLECSKDEHDLCFKAPDLATFADILRAMNGEKAPQTVC